MSELPAARLQRKPQLTADRPQLLAFRSKLGDYSRRRWRSRPTRLRPRRRSPIGSSAISWRLAEGEDRAESKVERAYWPRSSASSPRGISVGAGRQVLERLVAEAGSDPAAIVAVESLAAHRR